MARVAPGKKYRQPGHSFTCDRIALRASPSQTLVQEKNNYRVAERFAKANE
jgi:hypothetical protein